MDSIKNFFVNQVHRLFDSFFKKSLFKVSNQKNDQHGSFVHYYSKRSDVCISIGYDIWEGMVFVSLERHYSINKSLEWFFDNKIWLSDVLELIKIPNDLLQKKVARSKSDVKEQLVYVKEIFENNTEIFTDIALLNRLINKNKELALNERAEERMRLAKNKANNLFKEGKYPEAIGIFEEYIDKLTQAEKIKLRIAKKRI